MVGGRRPTTNGWRYAPAIGMHPRFSHAPPIRKAGAYTQTPHHPRKRTGCLCAILERLRDPMPAHVSRPRLYAISLDHCAIPCRAHSTPCRAHLRAAHVTRARAPCRYRVPGLSLLIIRDALRESRRVNGGQSMVSRVVLVNKYGRLLIAGYQTRRFTCRNHSTVSTGI